MKSNYTNLVTGLYRNQVKGDKGVRVRIVEGASVQHPISIRSASDGTRWQSGGSMLRRIAIALLMILTLGVGQMWAETLHVRGYSSWSDVTANAMSGTSSPWTFIARWESAGEFKISSDQSGYTWLGGTLSAFDSQITLSTSGNNMTLPSVASDGGWYKITVTKSGTTYKLTATKVVEEGGTAYSISSSPYIYFNVAAASSAYTSASILLGKSDGSQDYAMSGKITNTQLFYKQMPNWSNYKTFLFIAANNWGGSWSSQKVTERIGSVTNTNTYNTGMSGNYHMFTVASGDDNAALSYTSQTTYSALLNKTQTIQVRVSEDNGANYSNAAFAAWPGSITVARTYMSSATASSSPSATAMTAATTSAAITSSITFTGANTTEYTFAGWSNSSTGPDGNTSKTYTITDAATKYAFYKRKQYTLSYGVNSSTRYGSITLNSGSAVTTTSSSTLNHGTSISFTASANSGYQVEGWYSDASCTVGNRLQEGGTSYNAGTLTAAKTVYVKFKVRTGGTITLSAGANGTVSADNSTWGSTKTITDVTTATDVNIYAKGNTGYQFSSWTKSSGSGTVKTNAASGVFTTVAYEDATVTASFSEVMSTLSTSCHYDVGNPSYSAPTVSGSATNVGYATTRTITATAAGTGYTFAGWTLTNCTRTDGGGATANPITIRSNGDGAAATVVANYTEDLSSPWHLLGASTPFGGWSSSNSNMLQKASGSSTGSVASITINVSSLPSAEEYTFKLYNASTDKWRTNSGYWVTRANNNPTLSTEGGTSNELIFKPDIAGNYVFTLDYSSSNPVLTVTFPTTYTLTYSIGSVAGNNGSITTSPTTTSGSAVLSGNSVTLTAPAAKSGYAWKGWYTNAAGTEGKIADVSRAITVTMNADKTLYACYTENKTSVTISAGSNGSVTNAGTYSLGVATTKSSTATANAGYYFTSWSTTGNAAVSSTSTATTTVKGNGTNGGSGTATANFAKRWVLRGSREDGETAEGMPLWSTTTADMTVSAGTSTKTVTLLPNRTYKYMIHDKANPTINGNTGQRGCTSDNQASATQPANTAWKLNGTNPVFFNTAGYGTYTFSITVDDGYPSVTITNPTSWQITMGTKTCTDGCGTPEEVGGTNTAVDGDGYTIVNSNYVKDNGSVTFTAVPNSGYQFMGWVTSAACNAEPIATITPYTISNITSAKTMYAWFKEILFTVTVDNGSTIKRDSVGVISHPTITAVVPSGKVFDRWVTTGSAVVAAPYSATTTLTGASDNQSTITATFKDLPKIYIDLEAATDWRPSNMYVYFYKGDCWNATHGASATDADLIVGQCEMTKIDGTNIWYYPYDPTSGSFEGKTITHIVFAQQSQNSGYFWSTTAVYRTDFKSCMNMFVLTDNTGAKDGGSHDCYYRNTNVIAGHGEKGYWRNYEEDNSGFYINNMPGGSYEFTNDNAGNTYSVSLNLDPSTTYYFYIGGCNSWNWSNDNTTNAFNSDNRTRVLYPYNDVSNDGLRCKLTTTAGGFYTFKLTPLNTGRQIQISIDFPVAANDYRAVYNNAVSSPTISRPSNIIKSSESSGTISLWLNQGTNYITFEKCSIASGGTVHWVADGSQTITSIPKAGVYTMTLKKSGSPRITTSTIVQYTGDYYILTDCAPGRWRDYTENRMDKNTLTFSESDATTFDHYFCKWVSDAGTNVRFVVANDINMAISDTLKGDAALGGDETLPEAANIRFSYNSFTNGVNRAYISGASNPNDRFLIMVGDSKLFDKNGAALDYSSTYDQLVANEAYFYDKNNWVYEVDVQAKSGAQVYLVAKYNGADRDLYGSSSAKKTLLTSNDGDKKYNLTTIYDFKTNNLMTSWRPGGSPITENINPAPDVMYLRSHHGDAEQITFNKGSVANTQVYGVMQFNKWTLNNQSTEAGHATLSPALSPYERALYFISFPFDVKLSEVFGFGEYGIHWIIKYYDGAGRAEKGFWSDSPSFWKFVTDRSTYELKAGVGYILALDLDQLRTSSTVWNNGVTEVALYFPSKDRINIDIAAPTSFSVPAHTCTINRGTAQGDRRVKDSNWNIIGVPVLYNVTGGLTCSSAFYYAWNKADNSLSAASTSTGELKSMHAYVTQFAGTINWSTKIATSSVAARRYGTAQQDVEFRLELQQNDEEIDQAFVRLSNEDAVTSEFDFNYDLSKEKNASRSNIYTMVTSVINDTATVTETAGNCLPFANTTTVVPVGVSIKTDGSYTFAMPDGTSGIGVTLVDSETGARTSLSALDYTTYLEAGDYDGRFSLEISPIHTTPTDIPVTNEEKADASRVRKVLIDGQLFIIRDGRIYNTAGMEVR